MGSHCTEFLGDVGVVTSDEAIAMEVQGISAALFWKSWYKLPYFCLLTILDKLKITSYDFCDSQGGKGACDRKAAHAKAHLKRFVSQGNDAIDAYGIKKGLESNKGIDAQIFAD